MEEKIINVVGTMFFKNGKLLIDKPRKRPTFQMIGGGVEKDETPLQAAIRECHEELGEKAIFDESNFEFLQEAISNICCLKTGPMDQQSFNPANAKAREIAEKLMRGR